MTAGRALSTEWIQLDAAFLEESLPMLAVHRAARDRDEAALWKGYRDSRDPSAYLDWIACAVGGRVVDGRSRLEHSHEVLIAVPVVLPGSVAASDDAPWGVDEAQLRDRLIRWMPAGHSIALNNCLVPFRHLGTWSPLCQQDALESLARQQSVGAGDAHNAQASLPDLRFLLASLRRRSEEPELPETGSRAELELRESLAAQIGYSLGVPLSDDAVSAPMLFNHAVQAGLSRWLDEVLRPDVFQSWCVTPLGEDRVRLRLWAEEGAQDVSVTIRLHQLEPQGLELLLLQLAGTLDHVADDGARPLRALADSAC